MQDAYQKTEQMISRFYEGVLTPEAWIDGLDLLCAAMGTEHAALTCWNRCTNYVDITESVGLTANCRQQFVAHYSNLDPTRERIDQFAIGQWYVDHLHFGEGEMQRSPFYQDFMRPFALGSIMATPLKRDHAGDSFLILQHGLRQRHKDCRADQQLNSVVGHMRRAVLLRDRLAEVASELSVCHGVLDSLRSAMIVANAAGKVMLVNHAAETIFRRTSILQVARDRLVIAGQNGARLCDLLGKACGTARSAVGGGMLVRDHARDVTLQIVVVPLPASHWHALHATEPLALLILTDTTVTLDTQEVLLQQIYALTGSEARVALCLIKGMAPKQIAVLAGVSISTIRSQMSAVFRKTDCGRQVDLVRVLGAILMLELHPADCGND